MAKMIGGITLGVEITSPLLKDYLQVLKEQSELAIKEQEEILEREKNRLLNYTFLLTNVTEEDFGLFTRACRYYQHQRKMELEELRRLEIVSDVIAIKTINLYQQGVIVEPPPPPSESSLGLLTPLQREFLLGRLVKGCDSNVVN